VGFCFVTLGRGRIFSPERVAFVIGVYVCVLHVMEWYDK